MGHFLYLFSKGLIEAEVLLAVMEKNQSFYIKYYFSVHAVWVRLIDVNFFLE